MGWIRDSGDKMTADLRSCVTSLRREMEGRGNMEQEKVFGMEFK